MESLRQSAIVVLGEETQVAVARRRAAQVCRALGLAGETVARAELLVVELAGNLLQHAGSGTMYLGASVAGDGDAAEASGGPALQVIAADRGPGIGDVARAMEDGFSTGTTPGHGLGAVRRLAGTMDVYSRLGGGTVISASIGDLRGDKSGDERKARADAAVLSTPLEGETLNGDGWAAIPLPDGRVLYAVFDGLGHGPFACEAAGMAFAILAAALREDPALSLTHLFERMHGPMHATRGAAVALACVGGGRAVCCGVGNISTVLQAADGTARTMVSHNGTVGHGMRRVQEFENPWGAGSLLVMHSDGIQTRWRMSQYPLLERHAPATIAGVLYRDAVRGRDDATVLVARAAAEARA